MIQLLNIDCMEYLSTVPDKHFDLAIVDPPYGIKSDSHRKNNRSKLAKSKKYNTALWNMDAPGKEYFEELFRVSKNQIVFGANHFIENMPFNSSAWIVWDKDNNTSTYADCELAWTSFKSAARMVKRRWNGMLQHDMKNKEKRIHPTQKPVTLYKWILSEYALPNFKILDTHLGSGSSAIACHDFGCSFVGLEINEGYFNDAFKRYHDHTLQFQLNF